MQIPLVHDRIAPWITSLAETFKATTTEPVSTNSSAMGPLARLTVLLAAAFPALVASDTPSSLPHITNISFSGNGCAKDPGFSGGFSDPSITYNSFSARYPGETQTVNCEVHIQASGASPGWQVALKDNWVRGRVALGPGTSLTYYTSVYFSQDAARTDSVRGTVNNNGGDILRQDVTLHSELRNKAWSPCTGSDGYTGILNINFRGALTGDGSWATFEAYNQNWDHYRAHHYRGSQGRGG